MVGRSIGQRGVGRQRALLDSGRRMDGSFYFFLELFLFIRSLFFPHFLCEGNSGHKIWLRKVLVPIFT